MLRKSKLVKKQTREEVQSAVLPTMQKMQKMQTTRDQRQRTQQIFQTTKAWLAGHRQQQTNARQAFAALFMNSDTRSNAL